MLQDFFENLHLQFGIAKRYQRAGMSHVYLLVLQSHLDGGGQFEQAQVVGNGGTLLTNAFAEAFLRQSVLFQQMLVSEGYFYGVQVFALYVFDERHFHDVLVICSADIGRDACQSGKLRSTETTLAGDNLVFVVAKLAQGDGLYDADFGDGIG